MTLTMIPVCSMVINTFYVKYMYMYIKFQLFLQFCAAISLWLNIKISFFRFGTLFLNIFLYSFFLEEPTDHQLYKFYHRTFYMASSFLVIKMFQQILCSIGTVSLYLSQFIYKIQVIRYK